MASGKPYIQSIQSQFNCVSLYISGIDLLRPFPGVSDVTADLTVAAASTVARAIGRNITSGQKADIATYLQIGFLNKQEIANRCSTSTRAVARVKHNLYYFGTSLAPRLKLGRRRRITLEVR